MKKIQTRLMEIYKEIRPNFRSGSYVPAGGSAEWYAQCLRNNEAAKVSGDAEAMKAAWGLLEKETEEEKKNSKGQECPKCRAERFRLVISENELKAVCPCGWEVEFSGDFYISPICGDDTKLRIVEVESYMTIRMGFPMRRGIGWTE